MSKKEIKFTFKKTKLFVYLFLIALITFLSGCNKSSYVKKEYDLDMPNIEIENDILNLSKVENATKYAIKISGNLYNVENNDYDNEKIFYTTETQYDLSLILSPDEYYEISVKAIGDQIKYFDSEERSMTYTTKEVTPGLLYTLNEDKNSYSVSKGTAKLEGEIIFPDTYNGLPITCVGNGDVNQGFGVVIPIQAGSKTIPITGVRFPLGLVEICDGALMSTMIKKVVLPTKVKRIGGSAFYYSKYLTEVVLNEKLEEIGIGAFSNNLIEKIDIPDSVISIGRDAFRDTNISEISISENNNIEYIHSYAFENTPWLKNQQNGLVYIENICYKLIEDTETQFVEIKEGTTCISEFCFYNTENIKKVVVPKSVTKINKCSFQNSSIEEIVLPNTITEIENEAFSNCVNLSKINLPNSIVKIGLKAFLSCDSLKNVILPNNLKEIGELAFSETSIEEIVIPSSIVKLDTYAFKDCVSLVNIEIPNKNIEFGERVFKGTSIKNFTWKSSYGNIPNYSFQGCKELSEVTIEEGITSIGMGAFSDSAISNIHLPNSLIEIGDSAFYKCINLESVIIPNGLEILGGFSGCTKLKTINIPNNVTKISSNAFRDCISLENINIPDSVLEIDSSAFYGCTGLKEINIPSKIEIIKSNTFMNCSNLEFVKLSESLITIEEKAFYSCEALKNIEIPDSVTLINNQAFAYSGLVSVELPNGLRELGSQAFSNCDSLTYVIIPSKITKMDKFSFYNPKSTIIMFYNGDEAGFSNIENGNYFLDKVNYKVYYYSNEKPNQDGNYWHYVDNIPTVWY